MRPKSSEYQLFYSLTYSRVSVFDNLQRFSTPTTNWLSWRTFKQRSVLAIHPRPIKIEYVGWSLDIYIFESSPRNFNLQLELRTTTLRKTPPQKETATH